MKIHGVKIRWIVEVPPYKKTAAPLRYGSLLY